MPNAILKHFPLKKKPPRDSTRLDVTSGGIKQETDARRLIRHYNLIGFSSFKNTSLIHENTPASKCFFQPKQQVGDEKCDRESAVVFVTDVNNEELIEVLPFDLLWQLGSLPLFLITTWMSRF